MLNCIISFDACLMVDSTGFSSWNGDGEGLLRTMLQEICGARDTVKAGEKQHQIFTWKSSAVAMVPLWNLETPFQFSLRHGFNLLVIIHLWIFMIYGKTKTIFGIYSPGSNISSWLRKTTPPNHPVSGLFSACGWYPALGRVAYILRCTITIPWKGGRF